MTPIEQAKLGPDAPIECPCCGDPVKSETEHYDGEGFTCNAVQMRTVCENLSGSKESVKSSEAPFDRGGNKLEPGRLPGSVGVRPAQNYSVELTQEQKRVKIAEYLGWTGKFPNFRMPNGQLTGYLPDYFNDLNACFEMEKAFRVEQAIRYRFRLSCNSDKRNLGFLTIEAAMCHATSAQRAEAFGKALNLW